MMMTENAANYGVELPGGCRITHGGGANVKRPFETMDLVMHELHGGGASSFEGQFGLIPFRSEFRLPRHVHIVKGSHGAADKLVAERILVLNGVGLFEANGAVRAVAPGSLVDIPPGVPHTWTACPEGVEMPDGSMSDGTFLMVYEYSQPTGFYPTSSTSPISDVSEYERWEGDLEEIRFPKLSAADVSARLAVVWDRELRSLK